MGCSDKDCCSNQSNSEISFPDTFIKGSPWKFYNHLISQIPEDITVRDYCLGTHWSYVDSDYGMGISYTFKGGTRRTFTNDLRGLPLREVAELSKSWCFEEASLGVAALNAWYSQPDKTNSLGAEYDNSESDPKSARTKDAFGRYQAEMEGKKVTVVGHFPNVERIAEYAVLSVLERNCSQSLDIPDPACEYILGYQDFVFITGTTIINKTLPRLLDLSETAKTILVGPSVIPSPFLFDWGVEMLGGSIVVDREKTKFFVMNGAGKLFGEAIQMFTIKRP